MTTSGVRRHEPGQAAPPGHRADAQAIQPAGPPVPDKPPGPFGDLARSGAEDIAELAAQAWRPTSRNGAYRKRRGARLLLGHLATFPGETWQDRWDASGLNQGVAPDPVSGDGGQADALAMSRGLRALWCLRVIRPSLAAFRASHLTGYADHFRQVQRDPDLDEYFAFADASSARHLHKLTAKSDATAALTVFGIALAELTPEALLHYGMESRRLSLARDDEPGGGTFAGRYVWHFLHQMGRFPAAVPATMHAAAVRGQLTVTEMVSRYPIRNAEVRALLMDYITRRSPELDYPSIDALARELAGLFWARIETINPGQQDLHLDDHVYEQWRAQIAVRDDGSPRLHVHHILMSVRSLYLDLQGWAHAEPGRWARWAARCPVRQGELSQVPARRRRISERMADRTRQRQPLLPTLIEYLDQRLSHLQGLLAAARQAGPGQEFSHDGRAYRRTDTGYDRKRDRFDGIRPVRILDLAVGRTFNVATEEDQAFWQWAIAETLRHSGLRAEELTELTHLSIRQYQRRNGEVAALLVVAPSKTDRERVIPLSAELFAVIAAIIRRHLADGPSIPLLRRYDMHERTWSEPMPFLFQRKRGMSRAVMSFQTVWRMLRRPCQELAKTRPEFAGLTFAPHDFRRLFATELVNAGLPIHIGASVLGHLSLQTTRGYVAVFNDDIIRHYQAHLERRRAMRPPGEYRPPTDHEWTEFEEHFDKRKVELGTCGRPYGTPCQHEHACLRCPVLQVDQKMLTRLDEIEADLLARRERAASEGWHGEIEGLDLTLSFLRAKRAHTQRFTRRVQLGLPASRPPRP